MPAKPYRGAVYKATHRLSNKQYIGKCINGLAPRKISHERTAANPEAVKYACGGRGNRFHNAIARHGAHSFTWEELYLSDSDEELLRVEALLIAEHKARGIRLYNISEGGVGPSGWKHTEESKKKLAEASAARVWSPESLENLSRGVRKSWEDSEARREACRQQAKGRHYSVETRAKIGAASKARSPESNARMAEKLRGRKASEETKNKISAAHKGRKLSEETKSTFSAAQRKSWAARKTDPVYMSEFIKKIEEGKRRAAEKRNAGGSKGGQSKAQTAKPTNHS